MVQATLWMLLFASVALTLRALASRSWETWWAASLFSLVCSVAGVFSIGALLFLLTSLQLSAAIAVRRGTDRLRRTAIVLAGVLVWGIVVPGQMFGPKLLGWVFAFPLVALIGSLVLLSGHDSSRRSRPLPPGYA